MLLRHVIVNVHVLGKTVILTTVVPKVAVCLTIYPACIMQGLSGSDVHLVLN